MRLLARAEAPLCVLPLVIGVVSGSCLEFPDHCIEDDISAQTSLLQHGLTLVRGSRPTLPPEATRDHPTESTPPQVEAGTQKLEANIKQAEQVPVASAASSGKASAASAVPTTPRVVSASPTRKLYASAAQFAAEALAATLGEFPHGREQNAYIIVLAILAACISLVMLISVMRSDGKGWSESVFSIVAHRGFRPAAKDKQLPVPPWEMESLGVDKAISHVKASQLAGGASSPVLDALPALNPTTHGGMMLSEDCFIVAMDALTQMRTAPVHIMTASGKILLQAAVRDSGDGQQQLQLTLAGQADSPVAVVHIVGQPCTTMPLFGQGTAQPYGTLVAQDGGGSCLLREGKLAMNLQMGFVTDFRVAALNADGGFLASGGRVRRGLEEMWKLRVCPGVDSLLIVACMLATILGQLSRNCPEPVVDMSAAAEASSDAQATVTDAYGNKRSL